MTPIVKQEIIDGYNSKISSTLFRGTYMDNEEIVQGIEKTKREVSIRKGFRSLFYVSISAMLIGASIEGWMAFIRWCGVHH